MAFRSLTDHEEQIAKGIVNAAFEVHKRLGPGLLERVYELCFVHELTKHGFRCERQVTVPIFYDNLIFEEALRLDVLVNNLVICELKAVEQVHTVWDAQILSHLRLSDKRLGFLINFNVPLIKQGIKRFVL
nr:GxxExxY protein [uncultured Arsenicibacter sp.]